jgi:hypothetical protein
MTTGLRTKSRLQSLLHRYAALKREREELLVQINRIDGECCTVLDQIKWLKKQEKQPEKKSAYPELPLAKKRETVQDEDVGDGATRVRGGRRQFWWRGAWRDA